MSWTESNTTEIVITTTFPAGLTSVSPCSDKNTSRLTSPTMRLVTDDIITTQVVNTTKTHTISQKGNQNNVAIAPIRWDEHIIGIFQCKKYG